ncbi:MAG: hypothetical protein AAFN81_28265 [Bacteroidota bacterium]
MLGRFVPPGTKSVVLLLGEAIDAVHVTNDVDVPAADDVHPATEGVLNAELIWSAVLEWDIKLFFLKGSNSWNMVVF